MRRLASSCWIAAGTILFSSVFVSAQSSLDALQEELKEARQQHQEVTTQVLTNFFAQVDPAMASPDAAVALYEKANNPTSNQSDSSSDQNGDVALSSALQLCGIPATPVVKENDDETETEKENRLAQDRANLNQMGIALQLQCGLMHYAALFIVKPKQPGLQDDWVAWLKTAAQIYPQVPTPTPPGAPPPDANKKKHRDDDADASPAKPTLPPSFYPADVMTKAMRDTIISKFLNFGAWGDKEQGGWTVKDLPRLYRANVLDPLRTSPTDATLAAWDAYIAMVNADEPDNDHWAQVVYPPLQFDRNCDDYAVEPSTEKLEGLVNLIKANPTNPNADDWISRVGKLMDDYRARHGGAPMNAQAPAAAPPVPTGNPNVVVTTQQQGDAEIIITHTNSAPVAPAH